MHACFAGGGYAQGCRLRHVAIANRRRVATAFMPRSGIGQISSVPECEE